MRSGIAAVCSALALFSAAVDAAPRPYLEKPTVSFRALSGSAVQPNAKVRYVGAWELAAHGTYQLVGLSDLHVAPEGTGYRIEAVSDFGAMARFRLMPDGKGGFADSVVEIDPLLSPEGKAFTHKAHADAEGLTYDPVMGDRYVSFEGQQRIVKFAQPQVWKGAGAILPLTGIALLPANQGLEAVTYVREPGGDIFLTGAESGGFWRCGLALNSCKAVQGPGTPGMLYMLVSLAVAEPEAVTAGHDILALYRYFDPFTGPRNRLRLLHLDGDRLSVIGDLAKVESPLPVDNYEGVAVVPTTTGHRIFLISDSLKDGGAPKLIIFDLDQIEKAPNRGSGLFNSQKSR